MGNIASSVRESARTAQVVFRRPKLSALSSADDVLAALHANPGLLHQRRYFQNETIWHRLVQRDKAAAMLRILEAMQQMAQDPDGMDKLVALGIGVTHDMGPQELVSLFLNLRNANGETPLHLACMLGRHRMAELLVKKGADPWCRDEGGGRTPLHFAAMRDQVQCIHTLMKAVPPALRVNSAGTRLVDVSSDGGFTSLHYAIAFNLPRAARTLLAYHPDLHKANHASGWFLPVQSPRQSTALHIAAWMGHLELCKMILVHQQEAGHTPDVRSDVDAAGRTPQQLALLRDHHVLARLLDPGFSLQALAPRLDSLPTDGDSLQVLAATALRQKLQAAIAACAAQRQQSAVRAKREPASSSATGPQIAINASAGIPGSSHAALEPAAPAAAPAAAGLTAAATTAAHCPPGSPASEALTMVRLTPPAAVGAAGAEHPIPTAGPSPSLGTPAMSGPGMPGGQGVGPPLRCSASLSWSPFILVGGRPGDNPSPRLMRTEDAPSPWNSPMSHSSHTPGAGPGAGAGLGAGASEGPGAGAGPGPGECSPRLGSSAGGQQAESSFAPCQPSVQRSQHPQQQAWTQQQQEQQQQQQPTQAHASPQSLVLQGRSPALPLPAQPAIQKLLEQGAQPSLDVHCQAGPQQGPCTGLAPRPITTSAHMASAPSSPTTTTGPAPLSIPRRSLAAHRPSHNSLGAGPDRCAHCLPAALAARRCPSTRTSSLFKPSGPSCSGRQRSDSLEASLLNSLELGSSPTGSLALPAYQAAAAGSPAPACGETGPRLNHTPSPSPSLSPYPSPTPSPGPSLHPTHHNSSLYALNHLNRRLSSHMTEHQLLLSLSVILPGQLAHSLPSQGPAGGESLTSLAGEGGEAAAETAAQTRQLPQPSSRPVLDPSCHSDTSSALDPTRSNTACGVCWDAKAELACVPCMHGMCTACASALVEGLLKRPLACPFCRRPVADFTVIPQRQPGNHAGERSWMRSGG